MGEEIKERKKERRKKNAMARSGRRNAEGGWGGGWQKRRNRADEGKGGNEKSAEAGFRGLEKRGGRDLVED